MSCFSLHTTVQYNSGALLSALSAIVGSLCRNPGSVPDNAMMRWLRKDCLTLQHEKLTSYVDSKWKINCMACWHSTTVSQHSMTFKLRLRLRPLWSPVALLYLSLIQIQNNYILTSDISWQSGVGGGGRMDGRKRKQNCFWNLAYHHPTGHETCPSSRSPTTQSIFQFYF